MVQAGSRFSVIGQGKADQDRRHGYEYQQASGRGYWVFLQAHDVKNVVTRKKTSCVNQTKPRHLMWKNVST